MKTDVGRDICQCPFSIRNPAFNIAIDLAFGLELHICAAGAVGYNTNINGISSSQKLVNGFNVLAKCYGISELIISSLFHI